MSERPGAAFTYTYECTWGCTVHVVDGKELPHGCPALAAVHQRCDNFNQAHHVVDALAPLVRELKASQWESGLRDGRAGFEIIGYLADGSRDPACWAEDSDGRT